MRFSDYLNKIKACLPAREWNGDKSLSECWDTCERGDWMLWLMKEANMCDLRTLTLARARCAELARPHMKDERSIAALQAAFDFSNGLIDEQQLAAAAHAAAAAAADAYAAAYAAAAAAAAAADAAAYAAANAAAYAAAYAAAAKNKILKQCADICREVLQNPVIEGVE